jgi:hypothetical protein
MKYPTDMTAFSSAPALNFGTAVFLALMRSPVRGFRTQRATRTRFSKEPNPVIATFSPFATSPWRPRCRGVTPHGWPQV